jgi:hypothetical protein
VTACSNHPLTRLAGLPRSRPDAVVGIVLNVNAMNIAQNLSLWLSLVRSTEGAGVKVEVPAALQSRHSDTSQELLGKFSVINSLQDAGKVKNGMVVNIADGVTTWEKD